MHIPFNKQKHIENEAHAITKLCEKGEHLHIVAVLRIGKLLNTHYFFIDMELCDLNLDEYIHCTEPPYPSASIPYFIKNYPPPLKAQQIWNVMRQIASGVQHLHTMNMVHKDLKPANSKPVFTTN